MITENDKVKIDKTFYSKKTWLIAKSGYGKSYTSRVLIEEGIALGVSFVVFDPQEAYDNLPDFKYIYPRQIKSAKKLGSLLAQSGQNVVISTKGMTEDMQNKLVNAILRAYKSNIRKGIQCIVIDEAHKFIPEGTNTEAKEITRSMFQENRSDGLGIIAVSQRISRIDKTSLSQADNLCIGRVTSHRDKEAVKNYIDNINDIDTIAKLEIGEFYFYGFDFENAEVHKVRKSDTEHSGSNPKDLITKESDIYNKSIATAVDGKIKMEKKDIVKDVIPSKDTYLKFAKMGAMGGLGVGLSIISGKFIGDLIPVKLPYVSNRTTASAVSSFAMYFGTRKVKNAMLKDIFGYATAGASAYTIASLTYDILDATGVKLPAPISGLVSMGTGVKTPSSDNNESTSSAGVQTLDLNTGFAKGVPASY